MALGFIYRGWQCWYVPLRVDSCLVIEMEMIWVWSCNSASARFALQRNLTCCKQKQGLAVLCGPPAPGEQMEVVHVYAERMNPFIKTEGANKPTVPSALSRAQGRRHLLARWGRHVAQGLGEVLSDSNKILGWGSHCVKASAREKPPSSVVWRTWTPATSQTQAFSKLPSSWQSVQGRD